MWNCCGKLFTSVCVLPPEWLFVFVFVSVFVFVVELCGIAVVGFSLLFVFYPLSGCLCLCLWWSCVELLW